MPKFSGWVCHEQPRWTGGSDGKWHGAWGLRSDPKNNRIQGASKRLIRPLMFGGLVMGHVLLSANFLGGQDASLRAPSAPAMEDVLMKVSWDLVTLGK